MGAAVSAIVTANGTVRQLDQAAEPDEQIQPDDVADTSRLVRLLMRMLRDITTLRRRWWPRCIDFEDIVVTGTGLVRYRLPHGFGQRVRWWPVDWSGAATSALSKDSTSDINTLVLISYAFGTVTVRVEEAG